jgi:hypothetical protein
MSKKKGPGLAKGSLQGTNAQNKRVPLFPLRAARDRVLFARPAAPHHYAAAALVQVQAATFGQEHDAATRQPGSRPQDVVVQEIPEHSFTTSVCRSRICFQRTTRIEFRTWKHAIRGLPNMRAKNQTQVFLVPQSHFLAAAAGYQLHNRPSHPG